MSEKWQTFKLAELAVISFECPECHTQIVFNAEADIISRPEKMCPGCNKEIPNAGTLLSIYRKFYQEGKTSVTLRVREA
jgi:hypothetical protein